MNEELHSTNEELETLNAELHQRTAELGTTKSILQTVLGGLRVGVVVVDPIEGAPAQAPPLPSGHPPGEPAPGATSAGRVTGTIALSPKLTVGPSDVLYVMAKQGAATLAVRRVDKPVFPFAFEISGGDAMVSGGSFAVPVDIVARVSRTGDAIPAKGDLEGTAKNVKVPAKDVRLTIDAVRP